LLLKGEEMMNIKRNCVAGAAAAVFCLSSAGAMAQGSSVGGYYADLGDGDGFGFEGSFLIGDSVRLFGDVTMVDDGGFELDIVRIGGSYVIPMNDQMSFEVGGSFQNWEMTVPFFGSMDDDALGVHGILNFSITPQFHLNAKAEYLMFDEADDDDIMLGLRGTFDITPEFSLFGGVEIYNHDTIDDNMIKLGASFNF